MKIHSYILLFFMLIFFQSCENGLIVAFDPDKLDYATFIKTEKLDSNGSLNCNYGSPEHEYNQGDSYYLYFSLLSTQNTVITPLNPAFSTLKGKFSVEFYKKNEEDYVKDTDIEVGEIEFVNLNKNLNQKQNFDFLIDVSQDKECVGTSDTNNCSLSGAITNHDFVNLLENIKTAFKNLFSDFENENENFLEDIFMAIRFMAFSTESNTDDWQKDLTPIYIENMSSCDKNQKMNVNQLKNVNCYLTSKDERAYPYLKQKSQFHRKLFDAYIKVANKLKEEKKNNDNLVLLTNGYDESFYDTENKLNSSGKSKATEEDFFNTLTKEDNIPVFIAPQDRTIEKSFPSEPNIPNEMDIDNKFYKLACLTQGAYLPIVYRNNNWEKVKPDDYQNIIKKIKFASYGMYRVKIKLNSNNSEKFYDGGFVIKTKTKKGKDTKTELTKFRLIK